MITAGVQVLAKKTPWPLTGPEIGFWFLAILVNLVVDHVRPIPSYVGSPAAHVLFHHLNVFMWVNLLWMFSSRTRRLRKIYYAYLKRRNPSVVIGATPITGWDSSDTASSDRLW